MAAGRDNARQCVGRAANTLTRARRERARQHRDRDRDRDRDKTDRPRGRQTDRDRDRDKTETQTETQTERQRQRGGAPGGGTPGSIGGGPPGSGGGGPPGSGGVLRSKTIPPGALRYSWAAAIPPIRPAHTASQPPGVPPPAGEGGKQRRALVTHRALAPAVTEPHTFLNGASRAVTRASHLALTTRLRRISARCWVGLPLC